MPTKRTSTRAKSPPKGSGLRDWRSETLERMRKLILAAAPGIVEERKWKKASNPAGVPVWSKHGIICTGETYKSHVKFTFMHGATIPDPTGLFEPGAPGVRRAIDLVEGEEVPGAAFKALIRAAVALNAAKKSS